MSQRIQKQDSEKESKEAVIIKEIYNEIDKQCNDLLKRVESYRSSLIYHVTNSDFNFEGSKDYIEHLRWYREYEAKYNAFSFLKNFVYEICRNNGLYDKYRSSNTK